MLKHDFSEKLKTKMKELFRRDKRRYNILLKKIQQISDSDEFSI